MDDNRTQVERAAALAAADRTLIEEAQKTSRSLRDYFQKLQDDDALIDAWLREAFRQELPTKPPVIPDYSDDELAEYVRGDLTDLEIRRISWHSSHSGELLARIAAVRERIQASEALLDDSVDE